MPTLYFAFGSNTLTAQMRERCPAAEHVGIGYVSGFALAFAGQSQSQSGAGVATLRADPAATVMGRLWLLSDACLALMDRYEGAPHFYARETVTVTVDTPEGPITVEATTYVLPASLPLNGPRAAYVDRIRTGYTEAGLGDGALVALTSAVDAAGAPPQPSGGFTPPGALWGRSWGAYWPPPAQPRIAPVKPGRHTPNRIPIPPKQKDREIVFVYGNDQRGFYRSIAADATLISGNAETFPYFGLYAIRGEAVLATSGQSAVAGELYDAAKAAIDVLVADAASRGLVRMPIHVRIVTAKGKPTGRTVAAVTFAARDRNAVCRLTPLRPAEWAHHADADG